MQTRTPINTTLQKKNQETYHLVRDKGDHVEKKDRNRNWEMASAKMHVQSVLYRYKEVKIRVQHKKQEGMLI